MTNTNLIQGEKKEYTVREFILLYMNDHNSHPPRWLRSIFYDEKEKIETILEYMDALELKAKEAFNEGKRTALDAVEKEIKANNEVWIENSTEESVEILKVEKVLSIIKTING